MGKLNDETGVPVKWFFMLVAGFFAMGSVLVGLALWAGSVEARGTSNSRRLDKIEMALDQIVDINVRLARIEGATVGPGKPLKRTPRFVEEE